MTGYIREMQTELLIPKDIYVLCGEYLNHESMVECIMIHILNKNIHQILPTDLAFMVKHELIPRLKNQEILCELQKRKVSKSKKLKPKYKTLKGSIRDCKSAMSVSDHSLKNADVLKLELKRIILSCNCEVLIDAMDEYTKAEHELNKLNDAIIAIAMKEIESMN